MMNVDEVRADLIAEQQSLDGIVSNMSAEAWEMPTPSPGWSIADQVGHLTYFDWTAAVAITDPDRFRGLVTDLMPAATSGSEETGDQLTLSKYRAMSPKQLLHAWRANRAALADASAALTDTDRVTWYGPSMGSKSFLTARLMEAWAHGQDIADTLEIERAPSDRIKHIAQLGYITHKWSYINRQLDAPAAAVRVTLDAPSGDTWQYGPDDADDVVSGLATDFCLVVTQRRHVDDTDLTAQGPAARDWMEKAQAFAGPATDGPAAGTHV